MILESPDDMEECKICKRTLRAFCDLLQKKQGSSWEIILKGKFSGPCVGGRKRSKNELERHGRTGIVVIFFFFSLKGMGTKTTTKKKNLVTISPQPLSYMVIKTLERKLFANIVKGSLNFMHCDFNNLFMSHFISLKLASFKRRETTFHALQFH